MSELILLSESDTISTLGSSVRIYKSSKSFPQRFTFFIYVSLSVLHLDRSNSFVNGLQDEDDIIILKLTVNIIRNY